jgi:GAF domain-containing protein
VSDGVLPDERRGDAPEERGRGEDRAAIGRRDAPESRRAVRATVAAASALRHSLRRDPAPVLVDLTELAKELHKVRTMPETLDRIARLALRAVPAAERASVTLPGLITAAATDGLARRLDGLQYGAGAGPTLDALAAVPAEPVADLAGLPGPRWRDFPAAAVRAGAHSVLSCPLVLGGETLGALTLYAGPAGAFGPRTRTLAAAYATHAGAALARAAEHEQAVQLRQAVASNPVIGAAIGILVGTERITEAEAFDRLRVASQHSNRKLRDIAAEIVARGR